MELSRAVLMLVFAVTANAMAAQAPATQSAPPAAPVQGAAPAQPAAAGAPATPSSVLQPALATVQNALNALRLDKWKRGSVRDEAGDHISALQHDMQANLPPLVTATDAAPGQLSKVLPLTKHLDAFYDVLLRVEEASRVAAPGEQVSQLQQALQALEQARIALDDQMQNQAATQEKQVTDLQVALRDERAAAAEQKHLAAETKPEPCKPATPARRKKRTTTAPAKSTQGTGTTEQKPAPGASKPQ